MTVPAVAPAAGAIDLRPLFAPRSVAVVGASPRTWIAETVRDNLRLMGSATRCHFVNPNYTELHGQPCYPSLDALPERPDVAVVALNPLRAAMVTRDAAAAGVPAVIIPGGGVVEGGAAAAAMQDEVAEIARRHGIALVGPNCMGVVDLTANSASYIGDVSPYQPRGGVAGIAQSGSVTDAFIQAGSRVGFSRIISCGSEVVLDVCDYLAYCLDDPETHSVILFVEGFKRPERFLALADRALELGKPIMAVKVGRSDQAQAAAVAHSGSLAGETRVTDAALDAAGVIRCRDLDELLETAELVEGTRRTGRGVGRGRTGVVTVSTGEASLVADLVPTTGLDLPPIPEPARAAILERLPTMGYIGNPMDPWGAADPATAYGACFEAMAASGAYDVLVLVHDSPYRSMPAEVVTAIDVTTPLLAATRDRPSILPVYVSLTSGEHPPEIKALLDEQGGGAPLLRGAVEAFSAIASLARWQGRHEARSAPGGRPWRASWPTLGADRTSFGRDGTVRGPAVESPATRALPERESLELLRAAGLAVTTALPARDADAAVEVARSFGGPCAVKIDAIGLAHKSDLGLVRLGLADDAAVRAAADDLLRIATDHGLDPRGLLVEPMAEAGVELIVGLHRDAQFGPAVVVGLGGIFTEVLDDVAIRLAPVTHDAALAMLDDLHARRILDGIRGRPPADREAVARLIVALARLGADRPDIVEVDLNPVIATPTGRSPSTRWSSWRGPMPDDALVLSASTPWGVRLTLNRPAKLNALTGELVEQLVAAVDAANADPNVRVIVIAGAGRAFSAGYDLTEEAEGGMGGPVGWRKALAVDVAATLHVLDSPKPVIAQLHGYALAGGLELAMACDLAIAAEGTKLGEPEIRYGSAPVTLLMPYLIGQKKTRELLLTGDLIDAVEAERIGLINRVVPGRSARGRGGRARGPAGPDAARGDGADQGDAQPGDGRRRLPAGGRGRASTLARSSTQPTRPNSASGTPS